MIVVQQHFDIDAVESEVLRRPGGVHETSFQIERDGRQQWFLSKKLTIADATGAARYLLTYNIEITAQIQAQRALDRTNAFLDAVIAGVFTVPGDGCVDVPAVLRELSGYTGWAVVEAEQDPEKADPFTYARMGCANLHRALADAGLL